MIHVDVSRRIKTVSVSKLRNDTVIEIGSYIFSFNLTDTGHGFVYLCYSVENKDKKTKIDNQHGFTSMSATILFLPGGVLHFIENNEQELNDFLPLM